LRANPIPLAPRIEPLKVPKHTRRPRVDTREASSYCGRKKRRSCLLQQSNEHHLQTTSTIIEEATMQGKQMIITAVLATALCFATTLSQDKASASQEKASGEAKVIITNNKFEPKTITVKAGTEVTWENKEGAHTVSADDGSWKSAALTAGKTFSYKFDKPGKYPYYCGFHGGMGGREMSGVVNVTP
jgi:plastocyanin